MNIDERWLIEHQSPKIKSGSSGVRITPEELKNWVIKNVKEIEKGWDKK